MSNEFWLNMYKTTNHKSFEYINTECPIRHMEEKWSHYICSSSVSVWSPAGADKPSTDAYFFIWYQL